MKLVFSSYPQETQCLGVISVLLWVPDSLLLNLLHLLSPIWDWLCYCLVSSELTGLNFSLF